MSEGAAVETTYEKRRDFNNAVIGDWNAAMDRFFRAVEKKAEEYGFSPADVRQAMVHGYGHETADEWSQWVAENTATPPTPDGQP